jgi:hypothetical protein
VSETGATIWIASGQRLPSRTRRTSRDALIAAPLRPRSGQASTASCCLAGYDLNVELVDEQGAAKPIAMPRGLTATEYTLAARDLARLPPGAPLRVALTAHLPDGQSELIFRDFRLQ